MVIYPDAIRANCGRPPGRLPFDAWSNEAVLVDCARRSLAGLRVGIVLESLEDPPLLLVPDRVFDGTSMHSGWQVLVEGERISAVGAKIAVPADVRRLELAGATLIPGLIEGHGHLFLHPYNETSWDDQVLHESLALRTARAVNHARATLLAGFTTERDLGEGAGYADVGLKSAIEQGIVPGRASSLRRAIVASGAYGPKGFEPGVEVPEARKRPAARNRARGSPADRRRRRRHQTLRRLSLGAWRSESPDIHRGRTASGDRGAHDARHTVAVHASTAEGMRRAIAAGVDTIEHGYSGTPEIFRGMQKRGIVLCPTLAAGVRSRYKGWDGKPPLPQGLEQERRAFAAARAAKVILCAGGDVGVFAHGDNARELELMQDNGMPALEVLAAATSVNARAFHLDDRVGAIRAGLLADLVAVRNELALSGARSAW